MDALIETLPPLKTYFDSGGGVLVTDTATQIFQSPIFDLWYTDQNKEPDNAISRVTGAKEFKYRVLDFFFQFVTAPTSCSNATLVVAASARAESNAIGSDLVTVSTITWPALKSAATLSTVIRNPILGTFFAYSRFIRFTLNVTTNDASSPAFGYYATVSSREA